MNLDDRLIRALSGDLDDLEVPPGDVRLAIMSGRRYRRRRTTTAIGIAVSLVLAVVVPWGIQRSYQPPPTAPWGEWTQIESAPLEPRVGALATWTGQEMLLWGGYSASECGYGRCADYSDRSRGVAFEPSDNSWRTLARAPFQITASQAHAQVGDTLIIRRSPSSWWSFKASADEWMALPAPPEPIASAQVSVRGSAMYVVGRGLYDRVNVFDTRTDTWATLPLSPHLPRLGGRRLVATDHGILAFGRVFRSPLQSVNPVLEAEFFDGSSWTRLAEPVTSKGRCCWGWTGERLLIPEEASKLTSELEELAIPVKVMPASPRPTFNAWYPDARDGDLIVANGFVYDDATAEWAPISPPPKTLLPDGGAGVWVDQQLYVIEGANLAATDVPARETSRVWVYSALDD